MKLPTDRPAELVALLAIAAPVYGWLVGAGVANAIAALVGLAAGAMPLAVSTWRDGRREPADPGDNHVERLPPSSGRPEADEVHELEH